MKTDKRWGHFKMLLARRNFPTLLFCRCLFHLSGFQAQSLSSAMGSQEEGAQTQVEFDLGSFFVESSRFQCEPASDMSTPGSFRGG